MKKISTLSALLLAAALFCGSAPASETAAARITPEQALKNLMEGNQRYVEQQMRGVKLCADHAVGRRKDRKDNPKNGHQSPS